MNAMPITFSLRVAALCALAMGFAIRRGATCTVTAINQLVDERSASTSTHWPTLPVATPVAARLLREAV